MKQKLFRQMLALCLLLISTATAFAQVPANDNCSGATNIASLFGGPIGTVLLDGPYNNNNATPTAGLAVPECFPTFAAAGEPSLDNDLWFTFTGDGNTYLIETSDCNGTLTGTQYIDDGDTQIQIYQGTCGGLTPSANGCNEDGPSATDVLYPAGLTFQTEVGVTYYLLVDGFGGSNGRYCVEVSQQDAISCADLDAGSTINIDVNPVPFNDTMFIATTNPILVPQGDVYGLAWAISFDTLAQDADPRNDPNYYGAFPIRTTLNNGTNDVLGYINSGGGLLSGLTWCFTPVSFANGTGATNFNGVTLDPDCFAVGETICIDFDCNSTDAAAVTTSTANVCFGNDVTVSLAGSPTYSANANTPGRAIALYAAAPDPTLASDNPLFDPNFISFVSVDENFTLTNNFGDGGSLFFAPVTLENTAIADSLIGFVGEDASIDSIFAAVGFCSNVGTAVEVVFEAEIAVTELFTSCYTAFAIDNSTETDAFAYSILDNSNSEVESGVSNYNNTFGQIIISGALPAGSYTIEITNTTTACSTTATFTILPNTDSAGTLTATATTICEGADVSITATGAAIGAQDSLFSNALVWVSSIEPILVSDISNAQVVAIYNNANTPLTFTNNENVPAGTVYYTAVTAYVDAEGQAFVDDCSQISESIAIVFLDELTTSATTNGCAVIVSATGGDANNGFTFTITDADNNEVATGGDNNSTIALSGNGTYTISLTDQAGCTASTTVDVTDCVTDVCPTITGISTDNADICSGSTVTVCATANLGTYTDAQIVFSDGTNNYPAVDGCATISLSATGCGETAVNISASFDATTIGTCSNTSATATVNVYPAITATATGNDCGATVAIDGDCDYDVSWTTSTGDSGSNNFTATEGQSGTVIFTVSNLGAPESCNTFTTTAVSYNCPCPTLSGIEVMGTTICSGGSVTTMGTASGGTLVWKYGTSASFNPYTSGTIYTGQPLTAAGCNASTYYLKAYITGIDACQVSSDATAVMVYPTIQATAAVGVCGASVSITGSCDYTITWASGTQTGNGSYSTEQTLSAQSNSVTFTVTNTAAPAACASLVLAPVTVTCPALVCATLDGTQMIDQSPLCSGSAPMMIMGSVIDNDFAGGSVTWKYSTDPNFEAYGEGSIYLGEALTAEGCSATAYYFKAILTGITSCADESEAFEVMTYPAIEAEVSNGFECNAASISGLSVDCGFDVTWADSEGNLGVGNVYTPETGAIGTVTFSVNNPNAPNGCSTNIFEASYNCSNLVCSELDGTQSVAETAICSGQTLTLNSGTVTNNDFTGGFVTWTYSTSASFNAYSNGTVFTGNLPANNGCTVVTYYVRARLGGVLGCNDQSNVSAVAVYPTINATAVNGICNASVTTNCAAFNVTWTTETEAGTSSIYNAVPGQNGAATFTVSNLSGAPTSCATATVVANYNCPFVVCSTLDGTQAVTQSNICSGQNVTTNNGGVNNGSFIDGTVSWVYSTSDTFDAYTGTAFTGTLPANNTCNAMAYYLKARLDGVTDCQDQSAAFMVTVYPQISNLVSLSSTACTATVNTSCAGLSITSMFNGQMGTSNTVTAAPGESGTVSFTITNAGAPVACSAATLTATLNCPIEPVCTPNSAGVCSLSYLNLNLTNGRVDVCQGDGVQAAANGQAINDADYSGGFILHNSPSGNLTAVGTTIYAYSTTGEFINDGSYPYNTPLYVSAAVLLSPFGSSLSGECSAFSNTEEVRFYEDIMATETSANCNYANNTYSINYTLSGGDGTYTANGGMVMGATFMTDDIANNQMATYTISSNGCTYTLDAMHTCGNQPVISGGLNFVLSTATNTSYSNELSNFVSDADGDNLTFSFNTSSPNGSGTLVGNTDGSFTFTPATGFTGTVSIPFSVSDGNTPAVSGVITISVSDQILSCDQLPAIVIVPAIVVNPVTLTYNAWYYITGGLPSADGSSYAITLNDDAGFSQNFTGAGNSVFQANNLPYTIDADSIFQLTITATDNLGCTATLQVPVYVGLDVAWLTFTGEVKATGNELKWITATEVNNDYFTLERSTDGTNFVSIATLNGKGNSNTATAYQYLDKTATAGISYYRISQTNFDGTRSYGGIVTLVRGETSLGVTAIYPVPATHNVNIKFVSAQNANIQATIYDAAGRLMNTQNIPATGGENTVTVDVAAYASGVYFVKLNNGNEIITTNFVKQ